MHKENEVEFIESNLIQWHSMGYTGKNVKVASPENLKKGHGKMTLDTILQSAPDAEVVDFDYTKWGNDFPKFIDDCIKNDVDIIFNALHFSIDEAKYNAIEEAIDHGIIFVNAIGNEGEYLEVTNKKINKLDCVIQVGALSQNLERIGYSNKGSHLHYMEFTNIYDHEGDRNTGTSTAAPFFAGKLACLMQFYNEYDMADFDVSFMEFVDENIIKLGNQEKYGKGFLKLPNIEEENDMNKPKVIIIHHAAVKKATFESVKKYHIGKGWGDIGYHWYIQKNLQVLEGRKENKEGAHTIGYNNKSIGICVEGHYDEETPKSEVIRKLVDLIKEIRDRHGDLPIHFHNEYAKKSCPGKNFPAVEELEKMIADEEADWKEIAFKYLNDNNIPVHEKRFNAPITRAEVMSLIMRLHEKLK